MKNIIKMLSVSIIALFSFAMIVDAKVKETDNYTEDTYIIGYSRFSGNDAITADMAAKSGQYYERIYYSMNWDFPDDVTVYLKSELDGEWYTAKDGKPLTDKETNLLTENLLVFFVNGVEKTYEIPFSGAVDEGSLTKGVTFSNGKFTVPAYKFEFYFESNNAEVYAYVPYEWDDDDEVEYDFGEFEFIVQEPPKDIKETIVSQSNTIKNTYYNKQSNVTITDVVDDYYVNVGEYTGETEVDYITFNGHHYYQGDEGSLSVGLNSFIKAPIWKIVEGNVLVALPWLAAGSLPNGSTYIYLYDANENSLKSFNLSTYPSDENKTLSFASSTALFTKNGFTNKIEQSVDLNGEPQFSYTSGYGTQGFGVLINDSEGNPITDANQIIFRQSTNDSMAITFPEYNNTYVTIPKYQNGAYNSYTDEHFYYKLAIPGKGVIDLNFILNTIQEPLNINSAMVSQAETIKTTYYNKYTKQTITDVNSAYYVNVGKYQGNETPTLLTIAGNEYSSDYIGSLSIGRNSFIKAPVWKIVEGNVLVALPWLASDSLPNGATSININGYELLVTTYPSDEDKILSINRVDVLFAKEGHTALIENIGENYYRFTSSYGTQAYGVIINDTNGNPITDKNQIIFRKSQNGDMGLTFPDTVNGVVYAYASYPYYVEGVYTSEQGYNYDYKLAIPGKGVINFNLDLITIAAPKDLSQKMVEVSDAFKSTFYNKYNQEVVEINDELFSSYYVEIGEYNGLENPEVLTIAGVDYYAEDYKEISIGNNAIVRAPVWVIKEDKLYIALPWLAVESLPGGITTVNVGGQSIKLKTYPSDDGKYIEIASADVLFAVDGYMSNLSFNNGIYTYVSGHGHQALGFKFNDINGNLITEEQLIFRKSVNGSMGVTIPETLNGSVYTYALYPKWNDGEYLETSSQLLEYRLAIPGYGVTDLKINFVAFTNN